MVDAGTAKSAMPLARCSMRLAGSVACLQNVTRCQATVASCLDFQRPPQQGGLYRSEFSFGHVLLGGAAPRGARVNMVPRDDTIHVNTERLLDAIDEETLIVPISHVIFRSAFIQDVEAIVEKAHRVGAYVLLDSFQATGTLPFDVQKLNVDFCTGGVLKWLCGGPGNGISLCASRSHARKLEPTFTGWYGHENPFGFDIGAHALHADDLPLHARHFEHPGAESRRSPGLSIINEVGVENIRTQIQTPDCAADGSGREHGWRVNTPRNPEQRGGTVSIDMPNAPAGVPANCSSARSWSTSVPRPACASRRTSTTPMRRSPAQSPRWKRSSAR